MRALHFNETRVKFKYNLLFDRLKENSKSMTSNSGDIIERCKAIAAQNVVDDNINVSVKNDSYTEKYNLN